MMIESHGLAAGHTLVKGSLPPEARQRATGDLNPIDRLIVLQSSPLLANATAAQMWRLSAIARPVTIAAGQEALRKDAEPAILIVLSGELHVAPASGEPIMADAGDVIGMYETLAGAPIDATVTAASPCHALRLERGALFELLADHTDLLQGVFGMLSRRRLPG
jgi:CRP-like cAMP-binding protein